MASILAGGLGALSIGKKLFTIGKSVLGIGSKVKSGADALRIGTKLAGHAGTAFTAGNALLGKVKETKDKMNAIKANPMSAMNYAPQQLQQQFQQVRQLPQQFQQIKANPMSAMNYAPQQLQQQFQQVRQMPQQIQQQYQQVRQMPQQFTTQIKNQFPTQFDSQYVNQLLPKKIKADPFAATL